MFFSNLELFIKHFSIFFVSFPLSLIKKKESTGQDVEFPVKKIGIKYLFSGLINHYSFSASGDLWFHPPQQSTLSNPLYLLQSTEVRLSLGSVILHSSITRNAACWFSLDTLNLPCQFSLLCNEHFSKLNAHCKQLIYFLFVAFPTLPNQPLVFHGWISINN